MLPEQAQKRLEALGYGTRAEVLARTAFRILQLPGVSNDPVTRAAIELILRMELNPNADSLDIPEGSDEQGRHSRTDNARKTVDLPGI